MGEVLAGSRTTESAVGVLGVSLRQAQRLVARYRDGGGGALIHKSRGRPASNKLGQGVRELVLELVRQNYRDFGPTLAATELNSLVQIGRYEVVNLRSVVEVLKRTHEELRKGNISEGVTVFVGLSDEGLSNNRRASSCPNCTHTLTSAIRSYNATNDLCHFVDLPTCCYEEWASKVGIA